MLFFFSGTHYVAHYLAQLSDLKVRHESPEKSPDVLVSWPSRCPNGNGANKIDFKALGFSNPKDLKQPMVEWANRQVSGRCQFKSVIHLVRHPLRFLSSNFGKSL